jgi:hypothetical protein
MTRDYSKQIAEYWPTIMRAWREHGDKLPVIECDIIGRQVLAYPAKDYIDGLTARTRAGARRHYRQACASGGIMVFIRDSRHRILQSQVYSPDEEPEPEPNHPVHRTAAGPCRSDVGSATAVRPRSRRRSVT